MTRRKAWPKHRLGEVADLCLGKMLDKKKNRGELHPYLGNIHVRWGRFDLEELPQMRFEDREHERYGLKRGDLVVCEGGEPGRCALWDGQVPNMKIQKALHRVRPHACLDSRYLLYWFLWAGQRSYFDQFVTGATIKHLPGEKLAKVEIDLPDLPTQRKIAGILSAYDNLIENNLRRIKILEEMAQSLYREWFVHFRFPGHESAEFKESSLGRIPFEWEAERLGDIADISWGDTSTTKASYTEEGFSAYSATGLDGMLDHYDFDRVGVVLSAIGAQCGKTWLARGKWSCIKNTMRFWAKDERVSTEFLFIAASRENFWPRRGAAQPFIAQGDAKRIEILVPNRSTMDRFTRFIVDAFEMTAALDARNKNLCQTRDLLLPKLLGRG